MYCIGLTGTIASGKSTVAQEFAHLGITIISADHISKALTAASTPATQQILQHFGPAVKTPTNEINRKALREIIFKKPEERLWLESLLHPLIREEIRTQIAKVTSPYCLIEIPLLKDKKHYPYLNRILVVIADQETQIKRLTQRDHCTREHSLTILATQAKEETLKALADDLVINNGDFKTLRQQVQDLHAQYLAASH